MNYRSDSHCRQCGHNLKVSSRFCESCGYPVTSTHATCYSSQNDIRAAGRKKQSPHTLGLPGPEVPPQLGRGFEKGWNTFTRDVGGGIICALILFVASFMLFWVPVIGQIAGVALYVGFFGWVESVRNRNTTMDVGVMANKALDSIGESVVPGLVLFLLGALISIPIIILYILAIFGSVGFSIYAISSGSFEFAAVPIAVWIIFFCFIGLSLLLAPLMTAWMMVTAWGISKGASGGDALNWSWDRIRAHPLEWWASGLVLLIIAYVGVAVGWIGLIFTYPWTQAIWYEIISGEDENIPGAEIEEQENSRK